MKKIITSLCFIVMLTYTCVSYAATPDRCTITVVNNTGKTILLCSSITPTLVQKITIDGTTDTPDIVLGDYGTGSFDIKNNEYTGNNIQGYIYFTVSLHPAPLGIPTITCPLAVGNGIYGGVQFPPEKQDGAVASSNDTFAVSVTWIDPWHIVININSVVIPNS